MGVHASHDGAAQVKARPSWGGPAAALPNLCPALWWIARRAPPLRAPRRRHPPRGRRHPALRDRAVLRRFGADHRTLRHVEPWLLGAALAGIVARRRHRPARLGPGADELRGHASASGRRTSGSGSPWPRSLFGVAALAVAVASRPPRPTARAAGRAASRRSRRRARPGLPRRPHDLPPRRRRRRAAASSPRPPRAPSASTSRWRAAPASPPGRRRSSAQGLGCARCHGDLAQGLRGPSLAGGASSRSSATSTARPLPARRGHRPRLRGDQRLAADAALRRHRGAARQPRTLGARTPPPRTSRCSRNHADVSVG